MEVQLMFQLLTCWHKRQMVIKVPLQEIRQRSTFDLKRLLYVVTDGDFFHVGISPSCTEAPHPYPQDKKGRTPHYADFISNIRNKGDPAHAWVHLTHFQVNVTILGFTSFGQELKLVQPPGDGMLMYHSSASVVEHCGN